MDVTNKVNPSQEKVQDARSLRKQLLYPVPFALRMPVVKIIPYNRPPFFYFPITCRTVSPSFPRLWTTVIPADSRALILSWAFPSPPEIIAPA